MKIYKSIVDESILKTFSVVGGQTLISHVYNLYNIEMAISFAGLFCPEIVEIEDCIFISEFYDGDMEGLKKYYKNRKDMEMFVNAWSLTDLLHYFEGLDETVNYIDEFAKAIQYFWQMRLNMLFPDRNIVVEIGENLMGEEGVTVVVYQE